MRLLTTTLVAAAAVTAALAPLLVPHGVGANSLQPAHAPLSTTAAPNLATARSDLLARKGQLQFVPNRGQWSGADAADSIRYAVIGDTMGWLHDDGYTLRFERWSPELDHASHRRCSGAVVRTRFVDAEASEFDEGREFTTRHHFLAGSSERHARNVPSFETVTMRRVLPGIDVHFRPLPEAVTASGARGPFEYDLLLSPGADLSSFAAECDGVDRLRIDEEGRLVAVVTTPDGECELVQQAPIAWQETDTGRRAIDVSFRLLGATRYGFVAEQLDASLATVVDPGVVWGTFLGGGATDRIHDMAWQEGVGVWVGGWSGSTDFPTTTGAFQTTGFADAFVARLSDDGQSLVYATYLGGVASEQVRGIAVASDLTATVVGFTNSADFPTTPGAAQSSYAGGSLFLELGDAFLTRLSADGSTLLGSSYMGGQFDDVAEDVILDPNGDAIMVGWTSSNDFPMPSGGYQPQLGGIPIAQSDGFVLGVPKNAQSVTFGTFLGGQQGEQLLGVDRDPVSGDLAVAGWSIGPDYPTTPSVARPSSGGGIDAVVTRLSSDASTAVFSTYMGGISEDAAQAVHFDADGSVWIGGFTDSVNYPASPTAPQQSVAGANDGFLTRISSLGQSVVYSTLLGGPGQDRVRDFDLAAPGIMVVGEAGSSFPVTNDAVQGQFASGLIDGFATFLTNSGTIIAWSSYFGGVGQDSLQAVSFADSGLATIAGFTYSPDMPIAPAAYQAGLLGIEDGVVMRLDLLTALGPGIEVDPLPGGDGVELVDSGELELLRFGLRNTTPRDVAIDSVRVFVAASGASAGSVGSLRVVRDPENSGEEVAGPVVAAIGREVMVSMNGTVVPANSTVTFAVISDVQASGDGRTLEVAATIVDASAWQVHAVGAAGGPSVSIAGSGRASCSSYVLGSLAGDFDGSGVRTVVDVRRLIQAVGTSNQSVDVDGDGVLTPADAEATTQAILGRATMFAVPTQMNRDSWAQLTCLLPGGVAPQVSLGGRSLTLGCALPRQLTVRVDDVQPLGVQELVVTRAGEVVFSGLVEVL